jgi:hypothetical protein
MSETKEYTPFKTRGRGVICAILGSALLGELSTVSLLSASKVFPSSSDYIFSIVYTAGTFRPTSATFFLRLGSSIMGILISSCGSY